MRTTGTEERRDAQKQEEKTGTKEDIKRKRKKPERHSKATNKQRAECDRERKRGDCETKTARCNEREDKKMKKHS